MFRNRNRHQHKWRTVSARVVMMKSAVYPEDAYHTVLSQICECGKTRVKSIKGSFSVEDLSDD